MMDVRVVAIMRFDCAGIVLGGCISSYIINKVIENSKATQNFNN